MLRKHIRKRTRANRSVGQHSFAEIKSNVRAVIFAEEAFSEIKSHIQLTSHESIILFKGFYHHAIRNKLDLFHEIDLEHDQAHLTWILTKHDGKPFIQADFDHIKNASAQLNCDVDIFQKSDDHCTMTLTEDSFHDICKRIEIATIFRLLDDQFFPPYLQRIVIHKMKAKWAGEEDSSLALVFPFLESKADLVKKRLIKELEKSGVNLKNRNVSRASSILYFDDEGYQQYKQRHLDFIDEKKKLSSLTLDYVTKLFAEVSPYLGAYNITKVDIFKTPKVSDAQIQTALSSVTPMASLPAENNHRPSSPEVNAAYSLLCLSPSLSITPPMTRETTPAIDVTPPMTRETTPAIDVPQLDRGIQTIDSANKQQNVEDQPQSSSFVFKLFYYGAYQQAIEKKDLEEAKKIESQYSWITQINTKKI